MSAREDYPGQLDMLRGLVAIRALVDRHAMRDEYLRDARADREVVFGIDDPK